MLDEYLYKSRGKCAPLPFTHSVRHWLVVPAYSTSVFENHLKCIAYPQRCDDFLLVILTRFRYFDLFRRRTEVQRSVPEEREG
jgi:hypothetical protein